MASNVARKNLLEDDNEENGENKDGNGNDEGNNIDVIKWQEIKELHKKSNPDI